MLSSIYTNYFDNKPGSAAVSSPGSSFQSGMPEILIYFLGLRYFSQYSRTLLKTSSNTSIIFSLSALLIPMACFVYDKKVGVLQEHSSSTLSLKMLGNESNFE